MRWGSPGSFLESILGPGIAMLFDVSAADPASAQFLAHGGRTPLKCVIGERSHLPDHFNGCRSLPCAVLRSFRRLKTSLWRQRGSPLSASDARCTDMRPRSHCLALTGPQACPTLRSNRTC